MTLAPSPTKTRGVLQVITSQHFFKPNHRQMRTCTQKAPPVTSLLLFCSLATGHPAAFVYPAHVHSHFAEQPVHHGLAHLDVQLACLTLQLQCR